MRVLKFLPLLILFYACKEAPIVEVVPELLRLESIRVGSVNLKEGQLIEDAPSDKNLVLSFSDQLLKESIENKLTVTDVDGAVLALAFNYLDEQKTVSIAFSEPLQKNSLYMVELGLIQSTKKSEFPGATFSFNTERGTFSLIAADVEDNDLRGSARIQNISTKPTIKISFSADLSPDLALNDYITLSNKVGQNVPLQFNSTTDLSQWEFIPTEAIDHLAKYELSISKDLSSTDNLSFRGFNKAFYTVIDSTYKFPQITDAALLTKVQEQTFKYFWDFGHPVSGLARERNTSGDVVTIGGSGFGVMAILVGIERGFISRQEGVGRLATIVNFLDKADRFHGVWPHWMNGNTGITIPFSAKDNGADLVETAFMIQGLLTVRSYLDAAVADELVMINKITALWEAVEWSWFQQGGENMLTWHWSPDNEFEINLKIRGWNEALIIYTLAAASPTYPISKAVYDQGWARSGEMVNGNSAYGINMPLGEDLGGPLFFAHYSFLGLDPRNLTDQYASYMEQNISHSQINRLYCIDNPQNYVGYGENAWGLTASDNNGGYSAHSPYNDRGVITPTAAISSIPYTPDASMAAIKHFYYLMGDKLWGEYGFYDAYNVTENWYASSYLAIDQGPIILMIENYRSGLLWNLFMEDEDVQAGLTKLNFTY
jgi:hypothetical protein